MTTLTVGFAVDTAVGGEDGLRQLMHHIGTSARAAAQVLAQAAEGIKNAALRQAAANIRARVRDILSANRRDVEAGQRKGLNAALIDRLVMTDTRIETMARGLEDIADLADPVGQVIAAWDRPNGLKIERVRTPLGVVGVIYESRPNVTADAGGLCLKSGNAAILRCGSESFGTSSVIAECLTAGVIAAGLPDTSVQLVPTTDRVAVGEMMKMTECIDVIVPRGGRSLIERVTAESRVPLFKHLEGICHTYIHAAADPETARRVVFNAKMRRPGICGATETVLIDREVAAEILPAILDDLFAAGCEVRGDGATRVIDGRVMPATTEDWDTEYLAPILSIRVVDDLDAAMDHIAQHGSQHTDAIVTEDYTRARRFLREVDSSSVMVNASTRFADGFEYGLGAEIGISTDKLHARGPVGLEGLTTLKFIVLGDGHVRT